MKNPVVVGSNPSLGKEFMDYLILTISTGGWVLTECTSSEATQMLAGIEMKNKSDTILGKTQSKDIKR